MAVNLPNDPGAIAQLAAELERDGFVCLADAVPEQWLERARAHVRGHLAAHGEKFFTIVRPAEEGASPFAEITRDPGLVALLEGVAAHACPRATFEDEVYNVLRIIAGPRGTDGAREFHYDASVVTALVPVFMPEGEPHQAGELVAMANDRPYRRSVLGNLLEKTLKQNRWAWRRTGRKVDAELDRHLRKLRPGNLYLFAGYRTLHGNLPCAPGSLRATLLLHHGDPHGGSVLLRGVRAARKAVEARRRARA